MTDAKFWDKAAAKYALDPISDMDGYTQTLDLMRALLQPHHRVFELGCGTGSTALELADAVDHYIATDISAKMIEIAQAKEAPDHLSFRVADAPEPADVILALNLLHLVPDLEGLLAQIHGALPPGGLLIAKTALLRDGPWYIRLMVPMMRAVGKAPFVRNLSADELTTAMRQAGFEVSDTLTQKGLVPRLFTVARRT